MKSPAAVLLQVRWTVRVDNESIGRADRCGAAPRICAEARRGTVARKAPDGRPVQGTSLTRAAPEHWLPPWPLSVLLSAQSAPSDEWVLRARAFVPAVSARGLASLRRWLLLFAVTWALTGTAHTNTQEPALVAVFLTNELPSPRCRIRRPVGVMITAVLVVRLIARCGHHVRCGACGRLAELYCKHLAQTERRRSNA